MLEHSNTGCTANIEELILSCKPFIERLARKFAASSGTVLLEFDDYVSVGMVGVYEAASHLERCTTNLSAYLCGAANRAMIDEYRRFASRCTSIVDGFSLDAPLTSDSSFSLADLIPDRSPVSESRTAAKRGRAVRGAVKRLSPARRKALEHVYGLPGVGRHSDSQAALVLGVSQNAVNKAIQHGRKALRSDALLCKVVGVEVQA